MRKTLSLVAALSLATTIAAAQDPATCPMHEAHMKAAREAAAHKGHSTANPSHGPAVDRRHDTLGMSHESTHHSFRLFSDGGAIELHANQSDDATTIAAIRSHLQTIATAFAANDFNTPTFVHDRVPDGIASMERLHDAISYRFEELPTGARVRITTHDPEALAAVHAFLKFQVIEHRTANSGKVEAE